MQFNTAGLIKKFSIKIYYRIVVLVLAGAPYKVATKCVMTAKSDVFFCTLTLINLMRMYRLRSRWRQIILTLQMIKRLEAKELKYISNWQINSSLLMNVYQYGSATGFCLFFVH